MAAIAYPASFSPGYATTNRMSSPPQLVVLAGGKDLIAHPVSLRRYVLRRIAVGVVCLTTLCAGVPAAITGVSSLVEAMSAEPIAAQPNSGSSGASSANPVPAGVYRVQAGDSLWSIATKVAGGRDVRSVVDQLVELHGGSALMAGDVIDLSSVLQG